MRVDAEDGTGAVWAKSSDPRVTPVGSFLRLTRLDELPQLVNVIIGDMSLVGPRPERPEMSLELVKEYPQFHRRTEVKAGLTGLAQVDSGYASSISEYKEKLTLDIEYIDKRCFKLDFIISLKTIVVMINKVGAR
jgi:lipopolysaccharide/colanic/teichoic acid biosynthesis glycosyltransferase